MRSILTRKRHVLAVAVLLTLVLPAAWAQGLDDFKLTRAIPADAFLAVHCRDHEGKEFINNQYARVWAAVEKAHFDRDLKRMFKAMQQKQLEPGAELEGFEEQWQQIRDLCSAVDWASLAKREFAMGMKQGFPTIEFVMLMMPPEDKVQDNFEGLSGILKTLVEFDPNRVTLTTEGDADTVIHKVGFTDAPFPLALTLARQKDVIVIGFGPTMIEQSLALLRGEGGEALAATPRFQGAFEKLPPPADELVFVDLAKLFGQVRRTISKGTEMAEAGAPAEGDPGYEQFMKWKALPDKIIDAFDMWEYAAEVTTTDGMLATTDSITVLRDDANSRDLYQVLYGNKPLSDPLKYVPQNAGDFWVTTGVDLPALYKVVVKFLREDVPDGTAIVAQLESLKQAPGIEEASFELEGESPEGAGLEGERTAGLGIDIEKDVIGWIGGGLTIFSVPGPNPYSPTEFVFMLSVRDEAKAREMIDQLLGMLEPILAQQQGSIVDAEIEGAEGFKSVIYPMLAMFGGLSKPTVGVKDGWLFLGSSPGIIATAMEVAAGKAENFGQNERFLKEGIPPAGSVTSLSFTDKTKMGEQLGGVLQMVSAMAMMSPAAKDPMARSALGLLSKVGRVVKKLDFFQSSASRTTFDGKTEVTKSITTYREPPVITKPKPMGTEGESEEPSEE